MGVDQAGRGHRRRRWRTSNMLLVVGVAAVIGIVVAVGFLALTNDDGSSSRRRPVREPTVVSDEPSVVVEVVDRDFTPRSLVVRPGAEVTWEFTGSEVHTVTEPGGAFDSGALGEGETFTMRFNTPGEYFYYCELHHVMQGTLVVEAAPDATG
jgi:plastocyanin